MKQPKQPQNRRPHFASYWRKIWREKRDTMVNHLDALNRAKIEKAAERVNSVRAIVHLLPARPMSASVLRDQVAENWNEVYGEDLNTTKAWSLTRSCIKAGLFVRQPDGNYLIDYRGEIAP